MIALPALPLLGDFLRGVPPDPETAARIPPAEWSALLDWLADENLLPLFRHWLSELPAPAIETSLPEAIGERMDREYRGTVARNLLLAEELTAILLRLGEADHTCIPIRGLALAEELFGDPFLRPMGDIDLLVPRRDLSRFGEAMAELGYRRMDRRPGYAEDFYYTLKFIKKRYGWIIVEPRWSLAYPPFHEQLDMAAVFDRCRTGRVLDIDVEQLSDEDLILHLSLHLMHEGPSAPFLRFYELDRLIRRSSVGLDWSLLTASAVNSGQGFLLGRALRLLIGHLCTPVPVEVLETLPDKPPPTRAGRLADLLASGSDIDGRESLALFVATRGIRTKLRYLLALFFPVPDFMMLQYGLTRRRQLIPAYARRVFYFFREGVRGVLKLIFG